jgi:serine/threonine-protein kinase
VSTNFEHPDFVPDGYSLLSRLGSGQTSYVYLAEHVERGQIALKLPRPELQHRPVLRRMFENEVQITINLKHPNVVIAYAGYSTGPKAFLDLEYCPGGTLDQLLLEQGKLEMDRCVSLIAGVAGGLEYTHSRQVLHRDVKPANVFLTEDGTAKLGDFGTGIFITEDTQERVGTAFYMAPEIFEGSTSNVRTDVYSLGVLAYEVLTGVRPFTGDSYNSLMVAHTTGLPRDPRQLRDEVPKSLSRVVLKAMSRDPEKRFQSVKEFVHDFRAATGFATEQDPGSSEVQVGRSSRVTHSDKDDEDGKGSRGGLFGLFRRNRKS